MKERQRQSERKEEVLFRCTDTKHTFCFFSYSLFFIAFSLSSFSVRFAFFFFAIILPRHVCYSLSVTTQAKKKQATGRSA
jgi:hypothetical protein